MGQWEIIVLRHALRSRDPRSMDRFLSKLIAGTRLGRVLRYPIICFSWNELKMLFVGGGSSKHYFSCTHMLVYPKEKR